MQMQVKLALGDFVHFNDGAAVVSAENLAEVLAARQPDAQGSYLAFLHYLREQGSQADVALPTKLIERLETPPKLFTEDLW